MALAWASVQFLVVSVWVPCVQKVCSVMPGNGLRSSVYGDS